ncbi:MAG: ATP-binding protein [Fibrobacteria bacterium]|nr:ATP-binding protein [Fibrobacteria bacterium]
MDNEIGEQLIYLGLKRLAETWDETIKLAGKKKISYHRFLSDIISDEYIHRKEQRRISRLKAAKIPEMLVMETFPFSKQPKLKKKMVMELYDSMNFLSQSQVLCFIGPTGCGKSGLATSYLVHAINQGYRGLFIDFRELVDQLYKSAADFNEKLALKRFESYDCLVIDELGYRQVNKDEAGLFFDLMKRRHNKGCTLITTQLGFEEWNTFLKNKHVTMALLDRITECCTVFDMQECISIRKKNIKHMTEKN